MAVDQNAVFAMPFDGAGQYLAFGVAPACSQIVYGVGVEGARHVLLNDRAFVKSAVT